MKTSVIIPTVGRPDMAARLLAQLAEQTILPDQVILAEQGETSWDLHQMPPSLKDRITVLQIPIKSLALARQEGASHAHGDILFFLDDDILIRPDYISVALDYLGTHPSCQAVGGIYIDDTVTKRSSATILIGRALWIYSSGKTNKILSSGWGDYVRGAAAQTPTPAEWLFGCNMAVRAAALTPVSFPIQMRAWSFLEDLFFGADITRRFGPCMMVLPALSVIHAPTQTTGALSRATLRMRIVHRYLFWKHYIWPSSRLSFIPFCLGMIASFILLVRQSRALWAATEHIKTWSFLITHPSLEWNDANSFIFDQN